MSFDQDPNEQANISAADFAMMCDEMNALKAGLASMESEASKNLQAWNDAENGLAALKAELAEVKNSMTLAGPLELAALKDIARCYEELRSLIDGGSESMTHEDAVEALKQPAQSEPLPNETLVLCITGCIHAHASIPLYPKEVMSAAREIVAKYCTPQPSEEVASPLQIAERMGAYSAETKRATFSRSELDLFASKLAPQSSAGDGFYETMWKDFVSLQSGDVQMLCKDAARYRWLKDNHGHQYFMGVDTPAECGIHFEWVQYNPEDSSMTIDASIDEAMQRGGA